MTDQSQHIEAGRLLGTMREATPLVHNITNFVVMNSTANALLAAGAAPVMAHAPEKREPQEASTARRVRWRPGRPPVRSRPGTAL